MLPPDHQDRMDRALLSLDGLSVGDAFEPWNAFRTDPPFEQLRRRSMDDVAGERAETAAEERHAQDESAGEEERPGERRSRPPR